MELSFKKNFVIEEEHDKVAVRGRIKCDCGCEEFRIFHTGRQTKGILSSHIKRDQQLLLIEAKCLKCGKTIKLYDTSIDGEKPKADILIDKKQFVHKNNDVFKIMVLLNYYEENYMTNNFAQIFIHLIENNKEIVLYEE